MGRIGAGSLNQRITLVTPGPSVPDGRGGQTAGPPLSSIGMWARVRPLHAAEKLALGQVLNSELYEITIRRQETASAKQRVTWMGKTLNVQAVVPDEYNEYQLLTCINGGQ